MAINGVPITTSALADDGVSHTISKTARSQSNNHDSKSLLNGALKNGGSGTNGSHANGSSTPLPELDASLCSVTLTENPRPLPALGSPELASQEICTDHMVTASWTVKGGWAAPELREYGPLSLMPTASCLHYATECFEGMKLYRGHDGKLRLFRPQLNANRMLQSATRIALPGFNPDELLKLIVKLCATDGAKWLPKDRAGSMLYIRPTMIANDPALGVQKPKQALLYVLLCCFPDLEKGPAGMKLLASKDDMVRAWPGGFGFAKVGANYGPTLLVQGEARARGYDQVLWLFGSQGEITEAGASNFFVIWRTASGQRQLITAPLGDKIILDGVTRRSVLALARERLSSSGSGEENSDLEVVERKFNIGEVVEAYEDGRLEEAFVCGTAFFVAGVSVISWKDKSLRFKLGQDGCGDIAGKIKTWLRNIMWGKETHEWGYVVDEEE